MILRLPGLVALLVFSQAVAAISLPGALPAEYSADDPIPLLVNAITSSALVSYDFYDERLSFCRPEGEPKQQGMNLGAILTGERLYSSAYQIKMLNDATCAHLCTRKLDKDTREFLAERVQENYVLNWSVDQLPLAEMKKDNRTGEFFLSPGFRMGSVTENEALEQQANLNNHYDIYLDYHKNKKGGFRFVGAVIWPRSIDSLKNGVTPDCEIQDTYNVRAGPDSRDIAYTYSVKWRESNIPWATRWDLYLRVYSPRIHFLALANSLTVSVFLCLLVAATLYRTIHQDISRYNLVLGFDEADIQEDYGWKLLHAEVFRPPKRKTALAVMVGSGAQVTASAATTLFFALIGYLSPANRGSISTVLIVLFNLFGFVGGYVSSRLVLSLKSEDWRRTAFLTSFAFPSLIFAILLLLNFFLIGVGSSGAVPFGTILALVALWALINVPSNFAGAFVGARKGAIESPVRVNAIPRQIPRLEWYLRPIPAALIAGTLPFSAFSIEIYFIVQSVFAHRSYVAFGFLSLTGLVVVLTTATTTVLMTYYHIAAEDYRWHWRSFLAGGGSAFWLFVVGSVFGTTRLHLTGFSNGVLYLGYLALLSSFVFVSLGSIGFISSFIFLNTVYSRVRID